MASGVRIVYAAATGGTYFANIMRWSTVLGEGWPYEWDNTNSQWVVAGSASAAEKKITMTEQSFGDYIANLVNLDSYTGWVTVRIHNDDDANDVVVKIENVYVTDGGEKHDQELAAQSAYFVGRSRTWVLPDDGSDAPNIIAVETGSTVTVAMDFTWLLNDDTTISSISSVSVVDGSSLTTANNALSQDKKKAHFDATCSTSGDRLMAVTVTTTDGQTIVGEGTLSVT